VLLDLLQGAWDEHLLRPQLSAHDITADSFNDEFFAWCRVNGYALSVVTLFLECYAFLQGAIALEVFGHLPFFVNDPVAFFRTGVLTSIGYQTTETTTNYLTPN
jgi:hypothetical protein